MTRFQEKLKASRQKRGWTQKDVAAKLGITDVAYGDYERGRIYPSPENLRSMCEIFSELDFNEMSGWIEQEKREEELKKTQQRLNVLKPIQRNVLLFKAFLTGLLHQGLTSSAQGGRVFVVNTAQEIPMDILQGPKLDQKGNVKFQIGLDAAFLPSEINDKEFFLDLIFIPTIELIQSRKITLEERNFLGAVDGLEYTASLPELPEGFLSELSQTLGEQNRDHFAIPTTAFAFRVRWE